MKDSTFMTIAHVVANESKCVSLKVGAVIVKDDRIISTGYNGTPSGQKNCCEHAKEMGWLEYKYNPKIPHDNIILLDQHYRDLHSKWSKENEIHAELNAILFAAKNGTAIKGGTMYVTFSPCPDCAKAITQSGLKRLVYSKVYDRNKEGWEKILKDAGIEVIQQD